MNISRINLALGLAVFVLLIIFGVVAYHYANREHVESVPSTRKKAKTLKPAGESARKPPGPPLPESALIGAEAASGFDVLISDPRYQVMPVFVRAGSSAVWKNDTSAEVIIRSSADSTQQTVPPGKTAAFRFPLPGEYIVEISGPVKTTHAVVVAPDPLSQQAPDPSSLEVEAN